MLRLDGSGPGADTAIDVDTSSPVSQSKGLESSVELSPFSETRFDDIALMPAFTAVMLSEIGFVLRRNFQ